MLVYIGLKWHGGFVESIEAASGKRLIVFDDGDLRWVTNSDIQELLDFLPTPLFKPADAADGGVVNGRAGLLMAARLLRVGQNIIGTFVGATDVTIGGETMYQAFILRDGAFEQPARVRRAAGAPSMQDRNGFHTFRRGDAVEYIFGDEATPDEQCSAKATVFGVVEGRTEQGPEKALVLRCGTTQIFFLSRWPKWRRMAQSGAQDEFDLDDDAHASTLSAEDSMQMVSDFQDLTGSNKPFVRLDDYSQVLSCRASALPL